ncbi:MULTISPECIES: hypothetical protein [Kosakonia]|uniref:hypothetical protein n=1 Tax=Kosakonia TaxID=1330547 RepID=UPI001903BD19|nr:MULTISPECIES: hypothetical protein [unclassified Kosakonia]MBK0081709.1 hypothetical protein [Kosakonia sp. S57]MBK0088191.1 hypothetical protein [Kosakonia sp. S58]
MEMPSSTSDSVYIDNILYSKEDKKVTLCFNYMSSKEIFTAEVRRVGGVKLVSSDELHSFLMELMPHDSSVFKNLHKIIWDYIEGGEITFPIKLAP